MATGPDAAPGPGVPDPDLVAAAAMVFVPDAAAPVVDEADLRHLLDVLRLRPGEVVAASDGAGRWTRCRVPADAATGGRAAATRPACWCPTVRCTNRRLRPELTVAFAPTKGDRPEWVVQKLTELGVDRIVPLRTARSVVRWEGDRGDRAVERLRRVAREAAAQCRQVWLPEVADRVPPRRGWPWPAARWRWPTPAGRRRTSTGRWWPSAPRADGTGRAPDAVRPGGGPRSDGAPGRDGGRGGRNAPLRPPLQSGTTPCATTLREENWILTDIHPVTSTLSVRSRWVRRRSAAGEPACLGSRGERWGAEAWA